MINFVSRQGLLLAFVEYIKDRKTVVLEDIAAHFSMRVQVGINNAGIQLSPIYIAGFLIFSDCKLAKCNTRGIFAAILGFCRSYVV